MLGKGRGGWVRWDRTRRPTIPINVVSFNEFVGKAKDVVSRRRELLETLTEQRESALKSDAAHAVHASIAEEVYVKGAVQRMARRGIQ